VLSTINLSDGFKHFNDPNNHFEVYGSNRNAMLVAWVDLMRNEPIEVPTPAGMVPVQGLKTAVIELAHTRDITHNNLSGATGLGLSSRELHESIDIATFGAQQIVVGVLKAVELLLEDPSSLIAKQTAKRDPYHLIVAGAVLSAVSHRYAKPRLNGLPYYDHPRAVATILGIAARMPKQAISPENMLQLRLAQYLALNHDGFEDTLVSKGDHLGRSFLAAKQVIPSPLVHAMLIEALGFDKAIGSNAAASIKRLTKPVGIGGGRLRYGPYIPIIVGWPVDSVVKMADIHHNNYIDPKKAPIPDTVAHNAHMRKKEVYEWGFAQLSEGLQNAPAFIHSIGNCIAKVEPEDLDIFKGSTRLINLLTDTVALEAHDRGQTLLPVGLRHM